MEYYWCRRPVNKCIHLPMSPGPEDDVFVNINPSFISKSIWCRYSLKVSTHIWDSSLRKTKCFFLASTFYNYTQNVMSLKHIGTKNKSTTSQREEFSKLKAPIRGENSSSKLISGVRGSSVTTQPNTGLTFSNRDLVLQDTELTSLLFHAHTKHWGSVASRSVQSFPDKIWGFQKSIYQW